MYVGSGAIEIFTVLTQRFGNEPPLIATGFTLVWEAVCICRSRRKTLHLYGRTMTGYGLRQK